MVRNTLSLIDNFNQLTPYAVGFDRVFDQLNSYVQHNQTSTGFPPYNIRKEGDYNYVVEMALAGFGKKDIDVTYENSMVTIKSIHEAKKGEDEDGVLHRGISKRQFTKSFSIADDVEVKGAELKDGLLKISMEKIIPENKKARSIEIK